MGLVQTHCEVEEFARLFGGPEHRDGAVDRERVFKCVNLAELIAHAYVGVFVKVRLDIDRARNARQPAIFLPMVNFGLYERGGGGGDGARPRVGRDAC